MLLVVSSRNRVVCSTYSTVPSKPTSLTAKTLSHNGIQITWRTVNDNGGADVTKFVLNVYEEDTGAQIYTDKQLSETSILLNNDLKGNTKYR